ncbi:MAG TPA: M28 family peptidase, partial [Bryobacteraceae bacterium]|nr:M28 family peptidase [Bryobacteraceae bacterium]
MLIRGLALLAALSACAVAGGEKDNAETIAGTYTQAADRLIDAALSSNAGLDRLQYLCDRIGNRLSGSLALMKAVEWSVDEMKGVGLQNVHMITTNVPRWIRGSESASLVEPLQKSLFMLGLGGSVATPRGGITAEIVVVSSFAELDKLGERAVTGKIVVFDVPYVEYGETVIYRVSGASRAARLGAVGVLVRSITPHSLRDPHTGALNYESTEAKIPAAAITVEDAIYLHRLVQSGQRVRVHLQMESHFEPDATSADVTGDIIGREKPGEVVVIGGHLDSWDVGQGAHDDGAGVMAALEAAALIKRLGI